MIYRVRLTSGEVVEIDNPSKLPQSTKIQVIEEPFVKATKMCIRDRFIFVSAKTGDGVQEVLEAIVDLSLIHI